MTQEVLSALIWQARVATHSRGARAFAAHGYVDEAYRPPRLPFISVVGPLGIQPEPDRENGKTAHLKLRIPGTLVGTPRPLLGAVPTGGSLRIRFDGYAYVTLTGLPGGSFTSTTTGPVLATAITAALSNARIGGQFLDAAGNPLVDALELASFENTSCRYDPESRRFALSSGPGVEPRGYASTVELLTTASNIAESLGFSPPESSVSGRWYLAQLPAAKPFSIDVRLDFWAASQGELAAMLDTVVAATPSRGQLLLRPSLLAADATNGDTVVRLLPSGEPTSPSSLAHLETTDAATERSRGGILVLAAGATWQSGPSELRVAGPGTAATVVHPTPLVFNPLHAVNPAPRGLALTLDFRLESGLALGDVVRLVTLSSDVANVLRIRVDGVTPTTARLVATASFSQGGVVGTAETRWQVPTSTLDAGVSLHAVAEGGTGVVTLYINGQAQPLSDATATPTPPIASPGVPAATSDMELTLGRATGGGNPVAFRVSHLHLWGEALGPFEPALRRSVVAASALKPGDVIRLAETRDGCRAGKRQFEALVVSTQGDEVTLSKPVVGTWTRGRTIVFQEESFLFQTRLLRKDDLLNHLYRCSVDYRASALLDDAIPQLGAPLVERPEVKFLPLGASRSSAGHPGVTVTDVDSTQRRAI